ncbi:transcription initiation factor TFIID subunit 4 protein [Dioscorea alata]|uniref:Transcription initiation factor TFIID subunit 4 protein n=2 Tax=Dioscorea alata TaxID=55571 RepID=A0ACB7TWR6_DIOAL|nr:transcription initiation factor TFIID subunit 4 protein [Dioscorea alata]
MDPSIMKLLEDDEDESMHSGADVDAFTAALNRDIGGDVAVISHPADSDTGSSSSAKPLLEQWQSSSQDGSLAQQVLQQDPKQQPSVQNSSSEVETKDQGSGAKDSDRQIVSHTEHDQQLSNLDKPPTDKQLEQSEANCNPNTEGDQTKKPEQNSVQSSEQDRDPPAENQQQHKFQELNGQQTLSANQANNSMRRMKITPTIPFHMLIPILRPHLDKDRSMQLQSIFAKLRSNEVSKDDFLRVIRNIVGDEMLRQAAFKVQLQLQAQAQRNSQTNPNRQSLQAPTAAQPLPIHGQMQADSSFPALGNSSQKAQESENQADGKGVHAGPTSSSNVNVVNPDREIPINTLQAANKQQQHMQPPQAPFSMYGGTTSTFHSLSYSRPSMSSATASLKPQTQDSQIRQAQVSQGMVSTQLPMNSMNMPKYDKQISGNESKRPFSQLTSPSSLPQNSVAWQPSASKDQRTNAFPSLAFVKQEVEPTADQHKSQFSAPEGSSFGSVRVDEGNSAIVPLKEENMDKQSSRTGPTAATSTIANQISVPMSAQVEPAMQMRNQMSSVTPVLAGSTMKTPTKKPSAGQKKTVEALNTPSPVASKKQKTSGAFHDQSIEQLNDVTAVSGVNLREEEEQLLSAPKEDSRASEATRRFVQEEEERLILQKGPLQRKLADIISKCGISNIGGDVERCLSLCVEERLRGVVSNLIRLSKQRVDIEKTRHRVVITADVRRQILAMNQKAKEEWDKKQAEEAEKFRKLNQVEGSTGTDADKDKDEGRSKALKINKEEDDKMRTTAANVAARAAVGGDDMLSKWQLMAEQARQKREGLDGASGSQTTKTATRKSLTGKTSREQQETGKKSLSTASIPGGMRKMGKNSAIAAQPKIARSITVKDVIAVLEREPQMSKSTLIYRLYERMPNDSMVE